MLIPASKLYVMFSFFARTWLRGSDPEVGKKVKKRTAQIVKEKTKRIAQKQNGSEQYIIRFPGRALILKCKRR